jgi:uncharacterized protein (DUF1697 family)
MVTMRIGFLRAVNVGKRTVRMAQLVEICEQLGYDDVWTYVNSGNVVFEAAGSGAAIERAIAKKLEHALCFEVTTFVRSAAELRTALQVDPFTMRDGDTYFITFLSSRPSAATAKALEAASNDFDTLVVRGHDVHWHMRGKSTDTQLKRATWNLVGVNASTSRNVTMLRKLAAKIASRQTRPGS